MSQFPGAVPSFTNLNGATTLAVNNHASRHNSVHEEVVAVAEKVGVDGSADPNSHDKKIADLRTDHDALASEVTDLEAVTPTMTEVNTAIAAAILAAKSALMPVGSLYTNRNDATNPGTLLGFGTWVAFSVGRMLVGFDSSQAEFDTIGETGGAKTHTLTSNEMPSHSHSGTVGTGAFGDFARTGAAVAVAGSTTIGNTGGGAAHNNLPPYVVVYVWERTA